VRVEDLSRRSLLRGATVLAAAAPLAALLPTDLAYAATAPSRSTFTPQKGTIFAVTGRPTKGRATTAKVRLVSVDDLAYGRKGAQHQFSLTFRSVSGQALPQGTYAFRHPKLGTVSIFIVPASRSGDVLALFNAR
jgi:hypothetical protein